MLTRQGWTVLGTGVGTVVLGRIFGMLELYLAGAALVCLVLIAVLSVLLSRLTMTVAREVRPDRVSAGTESRVDVLAQNRGTRRTPVLLMVDPVSGTRGARLMIAPLAPGASRDVSYRLPTERRGIVEIGPLRLELSDPFGLALLRIPATEVTELTVYPRIHRIPPPPHTFGDDPHAGADHPNALSLTGEDFYALRPYVIGDDMRRVHWPSTARHDEIMVRQDELPWQSRTTIVLDTRSSTHTDETFEYAVSAAASVLQACRACDDLVRLISTDGADSGFSSGKASADSLMEYLAAVRLSAGGTMTGVFQRLAGSSSGGTLVTVGATRSAAEELAATRAGTAFGNHIHVVATTRLPDEVGPLTVLTGPLHSFGDNWTAVVSALRARRVVPR
ncbi:MAG: hypothetical protein JJLCMIEE_01834 [Acidimicrobiales bacterium]|nr:MAG: DUF58 domain-containing protein [Actinomycetota bacterium]MBV6508768.1 hypothetical protein [Acidimicrobiales bacterium]RIK06497.1 MAG: hypothetical protein DCC48_06160 [Acidobacteriota bacterium]